MNHTVSRTAKLCLDRWSGLYRKNYMPERRKKIPLTQSNKSTLDNHNKPVAGHYRPKPLGLNRGLAHRTKPYPRQEFVAGPLAMAPVQVFPHRAPRGSYPFYIIKQSRFILSTPIRSIILLFYQIHPATV